MSEKLHKVAANLVEAWDKGISLQQYINQLRTELYESPPSSGAENPKVETTLKHNNVWLNGEYVCGVDSLEELVQKQVQHGYIPTIRSDYGTDKERKDRTLLAQAYDLRATELGLFLCLSNYSRSARSEIIGDAQTDGKTNREITAINFNAPSDVWQSDPPKRIGQWWMLCGELDGEPELVHVEYKRGQLWAIDCGVGSLPVHDYHEGLTECLWQEAMPATLP
jgi:hypothetical protein